jgi:hypothetical protein
LARFLPEIKVGTISARDYLWHDFCQRLKLADTKVGRHEHFSFLPIYTITIIYHTSSYITFMVQKKDSDSNDTLTTNCFVLGPFPSASVAGKACLTVNNIDRPKKRYDR